MTAIPLPDRIDPERRDIYVCINCTHAARLLTQDVRKRVYHPTREASPEHQMPFHGAFNVGQQLAMFAYQDRCDDKMAYAIGEFLHRRAFEDSMGIRDPDAIPINVLSVDPTFEYIARRSDTTDRPMFPEEIEEWVKAHRTMFAFPEQCLDIVLKDDITYRTMLTQVEVFCLCVYLNNETVGSGSQLFTGRLVIGDDNDVEVTEAELEEQWNQKQRDK